MKYFYPIFSNSHDPKYDYSDGLPPFNYPESVARMKKIIEGVQRHIKKEEIVLVDRCIKLDILYKIHDKKYVNFLKDLCEDLSKDEDFIPSVFRKDLSDAPLRFRAGMYSKEIGTPLQKGSFKAALNSIQTAYEAACYLVCFEEDAFALTRPPGHHSGVKSYGGYGFFNNAFLASQTLAFKGKKPLILDLDYHIGDGSIELCQIHKVEYFSLHIDPWKNYPYLNKNSSFKNNIHLTHLPHKTNSLQYLHELSLILDKIKTLPCDTLVLSLGFDTLKSDYCQDEQIGLDSRDFLKIAHLIKELKMPLCICLEGGYDKQNISDAMDFFLQGLT